MRRPRRTRWGLLVAWLLYVLFVSAALAFLVWIFVPLFW
jgi:hypothetical protein